MTRDYYKCSRCVYYGTYPRSERCEKCLNADLFCGTWESKEIIEAMKQIKPLASSRPDPTKMICMTDVKFSGPATIVFWSDGTKTVVKCSENDVYDKEKGLAMAIVKKIIGNNSGSYYRKMKEWIKEDQHD